MISSRREDRISDIAGLPIVGILWHGNTTDVRQNINKTNHSLDAPSKTPRIMKVGHGSAFKGPC